MGNKKEIMDQYQKRHTIYQNFAGEVEHQLKRILSEENISYNAITCRLKDEESLSGKIDRKGDKYSCLEDLTDIAGVRVITYYSDDVDKVADIVEREFFVDRENSIDKREALEPDRFGYCSVHYVVGMSEERLKLREYQSFSGLKCEIQIRSVLQHAWAEIEHDLGYKNPVALPKKIRRNFSRLAGLLEIADKEFEEIRRFLLSYEEETTKTLRSESEDEDVEIDAILLDKLTEINTDIIEINSQIEAIIGIKFDDDIQPSDYEGSIKKLHWFGIHTLSQLYDFIAGNSYYAIEIAREIIVPENFVMEAQSSVIHRSIAFFYLCYAELITNIKKYDFNCFVQYFEEMNIGDPGVPKKETAYDIFQLREKLGIADESRKRG
ncbi:MAG: hypothetical protein NC124_21075 [Clostridium sp.]|nr:hypothetical protein [Clostridium sp.]